MSYIVNFGGRNPDFGTDLKVFGNKLFVIGHSQSSELSSGFLDIFVAACDKDTASTLWVRTLGTPSFNEYSSSLTVLSDGTLFMLGSISANGYTKGNIDILAL